MFVFHSPAIRAVGLTAILATVASAQEGAGTEKACEVNEGRPSQVGRALLAVQVASGASSAETATKQLASAVKLLTQNFERIDKDNAPGRNLVLGKALVLWTMQPNVELITKRGPLGYATDPEGTIDLAAAIDSSFRVVEAAFPECISETSNWRGQKTWVNLVNAAIETLNAGDVDAAQATAARAIQLNPYAPYGYVVMANVEQKRGNATEAFALYRKGVETAARDTSYDEIRLQSLIYLGQLAADSVEGVTDTTARKPYMEAARSAFEQVLADKNPGDFASSARAGLCRVAIASGDTSGLKQTYAGPLSNPATYSYNELMNAGVCLARAEMIPEAAGIFKAAYDKNNYHRDVLSNLSIMLLRQDKFDEALPLANRLVSVEPNNPDNVQLLVLGYAGIAQRSRNARLEGTKPAPATKTKAGARPARATPRMSEAVADSLFKIEQAYTDSAVKANERKEKMAYQVSLTEFTMSDEKSTIAGTVMNSGTASKPVTMRVEFLNSQGGVVSTQESALGNIPAGEAARFSLTAAPGASIIAFRYSPIE